MHTDYLVYEHWRSDTNMPFYVGKGNARNGRASRIYRKQAHHRSVVEKVLREGGEIIIKIVESGLPEESAFAFEKMKIAYWRAMGAILVNHTDGGDGVSGYHHTEQHRDFMRAVSTGESNPMKRPEVRAKFIGENNPQKRPERRAQLVGENNHFFGRRHTEEVKARIRAAKIGKKLTPEHRQKVAAAGIGRVQSAETRAKRIASMKAYFTRKRAEKELCGVAASGN